MRAHGLRRGAVQSSTSLLQPAPDRAPSMGEYRTYGITTRLRNGGSTLGVQPGGDPPAAFTTSPSLPPMSHTSEGTGST